MAEEVETLALPFADFPEDIQINVLSFLSPADISSFASVSRHYSVLCSLRSPSPSLWLHLILRRWGAHTTISSWPLPPSPSLYRHLELWDPLIGFWRKISSSSASLVLFEWGPSSIFASILTPSPTSTAVVKTPFLFLTLSAVGEPVTFRYESGALVPVNVSFLGTRHFVVEERFGDVEEEEGKVVELGSSPERSMFDVYQHFANRTSPNGGDKGGMRRRRRGRGKRERFETEHFVRISDTSPTPERPLQGLWKGICEGSEGLKLEFYLVAYEEINGVTCRRVGDYRDYSTVFWTPHTTLIDPPFPLHEQALYNSRDHLGYQGDIKSLPVSGILPINSSYELVLPGLSNLDGDHRNVEGRIWVYENGTFGFGFLRNNYVVDLKHITIDGRLLDAVECCFSSSSGSSV